MFQPIQAGQTMGGYGGIGSGQMTDEERLYWLEKMPAITKQESDIAQAQALSEELRRPQSKRMDWASQLSRGIEGVGSGIADRRVTQGNKQLDESKLGFGKGLADLIRKRMGSSATTAPAVYGDNERDNFDRY